MPKDIKSNIFYLNNYTDWDQGYTIYKFNSTKVDTDIKKSHRAKTKGYTKSGTNEKSIKIDRYLLFGQIQLWVIK